HHSGDTSQWLGRFLPYAPIPHSGHNILVLVCRPHHRGPTSRDLPSFYDPTSIIVRKAENRDASVCLPIGGRDGLICNRRLSDPASSMQRISIATPSNCIRHSLSMASPLP